MMNLTGNRAFALVLALLATATLTSGCGPGSSPGEDANQYEATITLVGHLQDSTGAAVEASYSGTACATLYASATPGSDDLGNPVCCSGDVSSDSSGNFSCTASAQILGEPRSYKAEFRATDDIFDGTLIDFTPVIKDKKVTGTMEATFRPSTRDQITLAAPKKVPAGVLLKGYLRGRIFGVPATATATLEGENVLKHVPGGEPSQGERREAQGQQRAI